MKTFNYLLLLGILSSSVATNAAGLEKTDIEQFDAVWSSSFSEDDTNRLMTLYSEEAMMFPPSSEILEGKAEIATYLTGLKENGVNQYDISMVNVNVEGDTAYETALWEATRVDAAGNIIKFNGNITNIFERQDNGAWKIKYQYWN